MPKLLAVVIATASATVAVPLAVDVPFGATSSAARSPAVVEPTVFVDPVFVDPVPAVRPSEDVGHQLDTTAPPISLLPVVAVVGASPGQMMAVDGALARFRAAGLPLPNVEIVFDDERTACNGHDGLFQRRSTPWRVLVCSELEYVLTHELAHAWEAANLDEDDRRNYVEHRDLSSWDSGDVPWGERGVEDAAFTIQQNLMAGRVDIESDRWTERRTAYEALTGRTSPVATSSSLRGDDRLRRNSNQPESEAAFLRSQDPRHVRR